MTRPMRVPMRQGHAAHLEFTPTLFNNLSLAPQIPNTSCPPKKSFLIPSLKLITKIPLQRRNIEFGQKMRWNLYANSEIKVQSGGNPPLSEKDWS